jgi:amino acid permease
LASQKGTASAKDVAMNLAKTAAGTGILALPFACQQGGVLLFVFGTVMIAVWNVLSLKRLCQCLELLMDVESSPASKIFQRPPPPAGTATLGKVAYYALGDVGLVILDVMLLLLLCGIVIAYEVAILSFSKGTLFTSHNNILDALVLAILLVPLCLVEDMSSLSKLSKLGLIILGFTLVVIAGYGVTGHQQRIIEQFDAAPTDDDRISSYDGPFHWLPDGISGTSHWFGCVVFGFGIVPLTFNFRESMALPDQLPNTALVSMLLVAAAYIVTGIVFLYLYPDIENDVLSELPEGWLATLTRLAMIVVVMATAPLLIVPCAEIIEGKIHHDGQVHPRTQLLARSALSLLTVAISVTLPGFVTVLAFVGCFSVSLVSFCVPPFLHWVLLQQKYQQHASHRNEDGGRSLNDSNNKYPIWSVAVDAVALAAGVAATVITTFITFRKMIETGTS